MTLATGAAPTTPAAETPHPDAAKHQRNKMIRQLARDVGMPMAVYYTLHALGAGDLVALGAGTALAGVFVLADVVRKRRLDAMAGVILAGFTLGIALTLVSGDARFVIAKESIASALFGAAFLVSVAVGKPLTYLAARHRLAESDPDAAAAFERRYRTVPDVRRSMRTLAVLWGAGLLCEAALRVVLVYHLPVSTMVWLSTVLTVVTIGGLIALTIAFVRRRRAAASTTERVE